MNMQRFCGVLVLSILLLAGPLTGQAGTGMIAGDFDDDGDVDLADFAEFQTCALGPTIPQADPVCTDARLDADEDVDSDDFEVFQGCLSGPVNPADPNCACPSGQTNCDGTCVNTAGDSANCGACGNVCLAGTTCVNGTCAQTTCTTPFISCDGVCVDPTSDRNNCGGCGVQCGEVEACINGFCESGRRPAEPSSQRRSSLLLAGPLMGLAGADPIPSDFDEDGDVDLADFAEFQTCVLGPAIPQTDPVCSDARLDADEDVDLDDFEVFYGCLSGPENPADPNCACLSGETNCDGTCTNLHWDNANCGSCGNACEAGTVCGEGMCQPDPPDKCTLDHPYYPNC